MADEAERAAARREKERLLRERRRQRVLADPSSRLGRITGTVPVYVADVEDTADAVETTTTSAGTPTSPEGTRSTSAVSINNTDNPPAAADGDAGPSDTRGSCAGAFAGTLTFEEGVELPKPSTLKQSEERSTDREHEDNTAEQFLPSLFHNLLGQTTAGGLPPRSSSLSSSRIAGMISTVILACLLGCAYFFSQLSSMRDHVLVRLLASDDPEAWINITSSSVLIPFFTLEAGLALLSIISDRLNATRESGGNMWIFRLPLGRLFSDMSLYLFCFVVAIDVLSRVWPWVCSQ